jgi:hypothetical protein
MSHIAVLRAFIGIVSAIPLGIFVKFGARAAAVFAQSDPDAPAALLGIRSAFPGLPGPVFGWSLR